MSQHSITFVNNTRFQVIIETWKIKLGGLSEYIETIVNAGMSMDLTSETGEWILTNYIYDKEMCNQWQHSGYKLGQTIGKFRDKPCAKGMYAWMNIDDFKIEYTNGLATLSINK